MSYRIVINRAVKNGISKLAEWETLSFILEHESMKGYWSINIEYFQGRNVCGGHPKQEIRWQCTKGNFTGGPSL